jgi:hypothetical protein
VLSPWLVATVYEANRSSGYVSYEHFDNWREALIVAPFQIGFYVLIAMNIYYRGIVYVICGGRTDR